MALLGKAWFIGCWLVVVFLHIAWAQPAQNTPVEYLEETEVEWVGGLPESSGTVVSAFWDLSFETVAGDTLRMADLRGRHILLNFWGEWCHPCLVEIPMLVEVYQRMERAQFEIVGMLWTDDPDAAMALADRENMTWPQVRMPPTMRQQFQIFGYPMNLLIMPDGTTFHKRYLIDEAFLEGHIR